MAFYEIDFFFTLIFYLVTNLKDIHINSMASNYLACYCHKVLVLAFAFFFTFFLNFILFLDFT